jgi:hypothetical protein
MRQDVMATLLIILTGISAVSSQPLPPGGGAPPLDPTELPGNTTVITDSRHDGETYSHEVNIVILANSIDYPLASDFFEFLIDRGIGIVYTSAVNFSQYDNERFIAILGGPDAYEGVGEVVQEVLVADEQDELRTTGNRRMYVKTNVWTGGQVVFVIAGSDRFETQKAHITDRMNLVSSLWP